MTILHADRTATFLDLDAREKRAAGEFASTDASRHYAPELRLEPVHLDLHLTIDLEARRVDVELVHRLRCNDEGADTITLNGLELRDLRVEGDGVRSSYDDVALTLAFDRPFAKGEEREVRLRYHVVEPKSGLLFRSPTKADPNAPRFVASDHETERARHWLCTVDLPAVRPTLRIRLTADASLTALANGRLVGERVEGATKTTEWALDQRCPSYLTCFAVGDFVRWDGGEVEGAPIACFAPKNLYDEAHLERAFRHTADMLRWIPKRLGVPYPYPKYFQFAVPDIGGAMENISLVSWDDRFLLDAALETEERQLLDVINLHEMAHTWFGDLVVCRDYAHAWLKEGWATYMEAVWLEAERSRELADFDLWACARAYMKESDERYARPIVTRRFDSSWDMYDHHLYPGAAWRIHMLRKLLGEGPFWNAVTTYLQRHAGGLVETDDFRRCLEEASGRSLAAFFDRWLHTAGYPKLEGRFRYDARRNEGTFELSQRCSTGKKDAPLFDLELDLAWWIDGTRHVKTARFDRERLVVVIPMAKEPERVRVDPDLKVLHDLKLDVGESLLRNQLAHDDVWGRILAARALLEDGKRASVDEVAAAFRRETVWGVRTVFAEALADAKSEPALEALLGLAKDHDEPQSLAALMRALSTFRDPRVIETLERRLEAGLPPRAAEAAWEGLGQQREAAPFAHLVTAADRTSFGAFAQGGALRALAHTRHEDALAALIERAAPGRLPIRARPHAVQAVGVLLRHAKDAARERAIEALRDLLRDESPKVRDAAAVALTIGRAREAREDLERHRLRLTPQERVRFDRRLRALDRGENGNETEKRVEELEKQLRKLTERLEKAEAKLNGSAS
jgi:aminopeptidase N